MLEYLLQYAERKGMASEPGFKVKIVRYALDFTADGQFLGVLSLGDDGRGLSFRCPDLSQPELIALKHGSHFLVESASTVALFLKPTVDDKEFAKATAKHLYFTGLLEQVSSEVPYLAPVAGALQNEAILNTIRAQMNEDRVKETDSVSIRVDGRLVLDESGWQPWWREFRTRIKPKEASSEMVCFARGILGDPAVTHPKIAASSVGGTATGSTLVSFDKDAFGSFGLKQSRNAAVSEEAATAYCDAMNSLIAAAPLVAGSKPLYWYDCSVPKEDDLLGFLVEPKALEESTALQTATTLVAAIKTGVTPRAQQLASSRYFCCTITGAAGRVMVRDWMIGEFEQLAAAVAAWFDDLSIVRCNGRGLANEPAIGRLVECLLLDRKQGQNYDDWLKPVKGMLPQLWRAALNPQMPLPYRSMASAVTQNRAYVQTSSSSTFTLENRMALLKAYLLRSCRIKGEPITVTAYLKPDHPSTAYQCGRLLAVLSALQQRALGTVNAGVVERYYGSASATPALVLGRLTRTSQYHLNKLDDGLARWYDARIAQIWASIQHDVPRTLSMEGQSMFALGYYHQKAADTATLNEKRSSQQSPGQGPQHSINLAG